MSFCCSYIEKVLNLASGFKYFLKTLFRTGPEPFLLREPQTKLFPVLKISESRANPRLALLF